MTHQQSLSPLGKSFVRVVIPDSHGAHIDWNAAHALLADIKSLAPAEVVFLGDHLDCGGTFSVHQRNYTNELTESYTKDIDAANRFLNGVLMAAPKARKFYIEGNHEAHVARWAARTFTNKEDADLLLATFGPEQALDLDARGIQYFRRSEMYCGLSIPGTIRLGKCFFTHGISHSQNAAAVHLARFNASVVYGHTHRSAYQVSRSVTSDGFMAACPGALCKLQPLYKHVEPTTWTHGYGVQFVNRSGRFMHINVPIIRGQSMLSEAFKKRDAR